MYFLIRIDQLKASINNILELFTKVDLLLKKQAGGNIDSLFKSLRLKKISVLFMVPWIDLRFHTLPSNSSAHNASLPTSLLCP